MTASSAELRQRAFNIIKSKSFFRGEVTLASGQKSDHYFDMKPSMFEPEGVDVLARMILERIDGARADLVGGLEMGAVPLIAPISLISYQAGKPIPGFFVRKNVKEHGTKKRIEAVKDVVGKRVVIVEDVTTTGQSAMQAIQQLQEAGAEIVMVISVVDRQSGAAEFFKAQGLRFESLFEASEFLKAA
jgi:orotate phosphoribosyltransferase